MELLSIELTNKCKKACSFCYSSSVPTGTIAWNPRQLIDVLNDCHSFGLKAVSFGGGEPLEYEPLFDVLEALNSNLYKSITTNGLLLTDSLLERLARHINKIHVSIHFPEKESEVLRVCRQVRQIEEHDIKAGINFLVRKSQLDFAKKAARIISEHRFKPEQIIWLPMRLIGDEPTPKELASIATLVSPQFQTAYCLLSCKKSPRFASINCQQEVGWCSYTSSRTKVNPLTWDGLIKALQDLSLEYCGNRSLVQLKKAG